jgi:hypothetical protein
LVHFQRRLSVLIVRYFAEVEAVEALVAGAMAQPSVETGLPTRLG